MSRSPSPLYGLPPELLAKIMEPLTTQDRIQFSLTSRFARDVAFQYIFNDICFAGRGWFFKPRNTYHVNTDLKAAVRSVRLQFPSVDLPQLHTTNDRTLLFKVLSSFPNLQSLECLSTTTVLTPTDLPTFFSSLKSTRLSTLTLRTDQHTPVALPLFSGPSGLKKLFITWSFSDAPSEPGSSIAQLYALVKPSLCTLVALEIQHRPKRPAMELDLRLLKPAGDTLRSFEYTISTLDDGILEIIADTFPNLTTLAVEWCHPPMGHSVLWDDTHITPLSRLPNLTHLALSSDMELTANDPLTSQISLDCWVRCEARRKAATERIARRCLALKSCTWLQAVERARLTYPFVVLRDEGEMEVSLLDVWMMSSRPSI